MNDQQHDYEAWAEANLQVVRRGPKEWRAYCTNPNHADGTPSMDFNVIKGMYYCRSCGWGGRAKINKDGVYNEEDEGLEADILTIKERVRLLESHTGNYSAPKTLPESHLDRYKFPALWAQERGFTANTIQAFDLGYDVLDNAGTIPCRDINGNLLGVTKRFLGEDVAKGDRYKYPFEYTKSHFVWGSWLATETTDDYMVLTEGYLDAAMVWQAGYQSGALGGAMPSSHQIRALLQLGIRHVIFMFDNDKDGRNAVQRCLGRWPGTNRRGKPVINKKPETDFGLNFTCAEVDWKAHDKKDPAATSISRIRRLIDNAIDLI